MTTLLIVILGFSIGMALAATVVVLLVRWAVRQAVGGGLKL